MNLVVLIGRLTRDPELRYTSSQLPVCTFTLAVDSRDNKTDFIRITVFDRQAENCGKYLTKGRQVAIEGRIRTGSYQNKNGDTVYTTDIHAYRVQFLGSRNDQTGGGSGGSVGYGSYGSSDSFGGYSNDRGSAPAGENSPGYDAEPLPDGFVALEDDGDDNLPF